MDRFTALIDFNQEKALVGAFSVITNLRMDLFEALVCSGVADNRGRTYKNSKHEELFKL